MLGVGVLFFFLANITSVCQGFKELSISGLKGNMTV